MTAILPARKTTTATIPLRPEGAAEKLAFTGEEAAQVSALGMTSIYKAIKDGQLKRRKLGTRSIITHADLASFLDNLPVVP